MYLVGLTPESSPAVPAVVAIHARSAILIRKPGMEHVRGTREARVGSRGAETDGDISGGTNAGVATCVAALTLFSLIEKHLERDFIPLFWSLCFLFRGFKVLFNIPDLQSKFSGGRRWRLG